MTDFYQAVPSITSKVTFPPLYRPHIPTQVCLTSLSVQRIWTLAIASLHAESISVSMLPSWQMCSSSVAPVPYLTTGMLLWCRHTFRLKACETRAPASLQMQLFKCGWTWLTVKPLRNEGESQVNYTLKEKRCSAVTKHQFNPHLVKMTEESTPHLEAVYMVRRGWVINWGLAAAS